MAVRCSGHGSVMHGRFPAVASRPANAHQACHRVTIAVHSKPSPPLRSCPGLRVGYRSSSWLSYLAGWVILNSSCLLSLSSSDCISSHWLGSSIFLCTTGLKRRWFLSLLLPSPSVTRLSDKRSLVSAAGCLSGSRQLCCYSQRLRGPRSRRVAHISMSSSGCGCPIACPEPVEGLDGCAVRPANLGLSKRFVILSEGRSASRRACPERSRRNLRFV